MSLYSELSLTAQTAYAQLLDATMAAELTRSVASLNGSFARKTVKGNPYWYFQYTDLSGKLRQIYIGPDSPELRKLIELKGEQPASDALQRLARSAESLGCAVVQSRHFRVVRRLADYGFFRAGGVLIGTHAFLAYGNMLGLAWGDISRTQDVDFAHAGKNIAIALPANVEVDVPGAIESLQMGFLPNLSLAGESGATYLNPKDPEFRLDFLTTMHRGGEKPYAHPQLGITLQPLKFMEFSLQRSEQAALFCAEGSVLVNLPHPARYALHKLLVVGERSGSFAVKIKKDLAQVACLLDYFKRGRSWEAEEAWADLLSSGSGWVTRAKQGLKLLDQAYPELEISAWLKMTSKKN